MLGWFGGYFQTNNEINTLRFAYVNHYNIYVSRILRDLASDDSFVYTAAARTADRNALTDLLYKLSHYQEANGSNSWNSVCKEKD